MTISLNAVVLMDTQTAAGSSASYPLDYKYEGHQQRTLIVACVAGDTITIEGSVDGGNSWGPIAALAGPQASSITHIEGPFTNLRVTKTGTTGVANVRGII